MDIDVSYKINAHRRLCIKKDLIELSYWIDTLSDINVEIDHLFQIEKTLLKDYNVQNTLQSLRRKNTLLMGMLCKYEGKLATEYEYGKEEYTVSRAKDHEIKRDLHTTFSKEFTQFRKNIYQKLAKFNRR